MITYVWNIDFALRPGAGGTENFTLGQVRELRRRGIDTEIGLINQPAAGTQKLLPDIPVRRLTLSQLARLSNPIVFASIPAPFATSSPAFVNMPYPAELVKSKQEVKQGLDNKILLAPSHAAAKAWATALDRQPASVSVVYPFAMSDFAHVKTQPASATTVLFPSRLIKAKGIDVLLAAHQFLPSDFRFTVTDTSSDSSVMRHLRTIPYVTVVKSRTTTPAMAELMAEHALVVVPTTTEWPEPFGMVSVEAQHAGCRVVASNISGLPETQCGGLTLVEPDDPKSLASGILAASKFGRLTQAERQLAGEKFTVAQSVDELLAIMRRHGAVW